MKTKLFVILCLALILCVNIAFAEGITPSEAPKVELTYINIQRVDVDTKAIKDGILYSVLPVPCVEYEIQGVFLCDGYHIIPACAYCAGDETLTCVFRDLDLYHLDGTVGLYLVWYSSTTTHNEN